MRVSIIGDTSGIAAVLVGALHARGHQLVPGSLDVAAPSTEGDVDAVVLNVDAPHKYWLSLLGRLRTVSQVPVLVWAARRDEYPVMRWLSGGADDYLVKPARADQLVTKIEALRRRALAHLDPPRSIVEVGDVSIDLNARVVLVNSSRVGLTRMEFDVLATLARHAGAPVSRQELTSEVWRDARRPSSRSLDTHMVNLRSKLDRPDLLRTVYGYGYQLG